MKYSLTSPLNSRLVHPIAYFSPLLEQLLGPTSNRSYLTCPILPHARVTTCFLHFFPISIRGITLLQLKPKAQKSLLSQPTALPSTPQVQQIPLTPKYMANPFFLVSNTQTTQPATPFSLVSPLSFSSVPISPIVTVNQAVSLTALQKFQ